jgi:tetratricopeptide (TPR) repeat protein
MLTAPLLFCSLLATAGEGALCDPPYLVALERGDAHHRAFDYKAAIATYGEALARDPAGFHALLGLTDAWNDRGEALAGAAARGAFERALGYAQCLEEGFPRRPEGPSWVAASYGNLTTAASAGEKVAFSREIAAAARRALDREPRFAPALVALGIYEREMSTLGFFARTALRAMLGGREDTSLEESERLLRQAAAAAPGSLLARYELGLTLLAAKKEDEARLALEEVLERLPQEASDVARQTDAARRLAQLEP